MLPADVSHAVAADVCPDARLMQVARFLIGSEALRDALDLPVTTEIVGVTYYPMTSHVALIVTDPAFPDISTRVPATPVAPLFTCAPRPALCFVGWEGLEVAHGRR
jgi:hypothetical protein